MSSLERPPEITIVLSTPWQHSPKVLTHQHLNRWRVQVYHCTVQPGCLHWTEEESRELRLYRSCKVQELELKDIEDLKKVEMLQLTTEQEIELRQERLPLDYFELAAGTSTGGIIGIMLFRLRMSTSEAIQQYDDLSKKVFSPTVMW